MNVERFEMIPTIVFIDAEYQMKCQDMWEYFLGNCPYAKGSSSNHQAYEGGYFKHIQDCMHICVTLYDSTQRGIGRLPFTSSDALLVLFLHDIEKPIKYSDMSMKLPFAGLNDHEVRQKLLDMFDIELKEHHVEALRYIHGEGDDYSKTERVMSPLSAFCHCCDVFSSRVYFN